MRHESGQQSASRYLSVQIDFNQSNQFIQSLIDWSRPQYVRLNDWAIFNPQFAGDWFVGIHD
jgi:hypothetical protein